VSDGRGLRRPVTDSRLRARTCLRRDLAASGGTFGLVEAALGLTPATGGTQRLATRAGVGHAAATASAVTRSSSAASLARCGWPLTRRNWPPGSAMPAADHCSAAWPSRQCLTLRVVAADPDLGNPRLGERHTSAVRRNQRTTPRVTRDHAVVEITTVHRSRLGRPSCRNWRSAWWLRGRAGRGRRGR